MAFHLNAYEQARLETLQKSLAELYEDLRKSIVRFNEEVNERRDLVDESLFTYNEALEELRTFVTEVAADRRGQFEERSETWQSGDDGQSVDEWIDAWENADLEKAKLDYPADVEIDFESHADTDLPTEP